MVDQDGLKRIIGTTTNKAKVVIERGPVANFAFAVGDTSPVYHDAEAARAAGLPGIPVPPTYPSVMHTWGAFSEQQPADRPIGNPMAQVIGPLLAQGGLVLHGEQSFEYHRPLWVGDVLVGEGTIVDAYTKESRGRTMTFVVSETVWRDERSGEPAVTTRMNLIHRS